MNQNGAIAVDKPSPAPARRYTYDELVAEMPETNLPCELWDGEIIMSPAPSYYHQKIVFRFSRALYDWVSKHQLGDVVTSPVDMVLSPHRVMQPDVVLISKERLGIVTKTINGPVDLAAEIISLDHRHRDRIEKRDLYEQYGVKEYWLIDPEARTVDVLHLESGRYQLVMRCTPGQTAASKLLPGFEIPVTHLLEQEL